MALDRWQAPDRDTPTSLQYEAKVELGKQLDLLLQSAGVRGTREEDVQAATGSTLSRPRRWHKMFERMGLLYPDSSGITTLTDLGSLIQSAAARGAAEFRRNLAQHAIGILRKYQLRNPADDTGAEEYPADTDIHPYWAIWKAAVELDGKLHWDELNRVLMWVLKHEDLEAAISLIRSARLRPNYDPTSDGPDRIGARAYDQLESPDARDPSGQVRDQKTSPWFKRAGLGELLLVPGGRAGSGYWSIQEDVVDLLRADVQSPHAPYVSIDDEQEWFKYYGQFDEPKNPHVIAEEVEKDLPDTLSDDDSIYLEVVDVISRGSAGVLLSGPPGTSKSWYARRIAAKLVKGKAGRAQFVQFHPSMGYDDFVEGYVPIVVEGVTTFEIRRKLFLQFADLAVAQDSNLFVLVIDEINRGDVGRIFGELLTYLEPSYRDTSFKLSISGRTTKIPKNLFIIGTFNPNDRSVIELDEAIDRRFDRIALDPSVDILRTLLFDGGASPELTGKTIDFFVELNKLSRHGIGHALFIGIKDDTSLRNLWRRKLRFILEKSFRFEPATLIKAKTLYIGLFSDSATAGI